MPCAACGPPTHNFPAPRRCSHRDRTLPAAWGGPRGAGGSFRPAVPERRTHHAERGLVEIGARRDDRRILPAHFRDDGLRPSAVNRLNAFSPTAREPVKTNPSTSEFSTSSWPTVAPGPVT